METGVPGGPTHGPWDTTMGKGVRIAIFDRGVDVSHPDIAPNLALNLSEVNQDARAGPPARATTAPPRPDRTWNLDRVARRGRLRHWVWTSSA
jgi:hypothetical protein